MAFELTAHDPDDRQRQRENERRYRAGHKAEIQERARRWRAEHPDYNATYYRNNEANVRARTKAYYENNKLAMLRASKAYRTRHRSHLAKRAEARRFRVKYGLSVEAIDRMLVMQEFKCSICECEIGWTLDSHMCVDHCHKTRINRALLCTRCNTGIGMFLENPDSLRRAAGYLELHNERR